MLSGEISSCVSGTARLCFTYVIINLKSCLCRQTYLNSGLLFESEMSPAGPQIPAWGAVLKAVEPLGGGAWLAEVGHGGGRL